MLDPAGRIALPELPNLTVYADHADAARFYAAPSSPRLALEAGQPQINVVIYGRKQGPRLEVMGGQCSLTTDLALSEDERTVIERALAAQTPQPEVLSFDWLDGTVEAMLAEGIAAAGTPSLSGTNRCALLLSLSADQATALRQAWQAGLPDALLRYTMRVRAAGSTSTGGQAQYDGATARPGRSARTTTRTGYRVDTTETLRHELLFEGPLRLTSDRQREGLQTIDL